MRDLSPFHLRSALGFKRIFLGLLAVFAEDDFTLHTLYIYLCMIVRDFHLVGTVSNNEEYSTISTNIHKLDKVVLMDYSGLAVGWKEAWWSVHQNKIS